MFEFIKKLFGVSRKPESGAAPSKKDLVGTVTHYYGKVNAAIIKVKNGPISVGDTIRIYGKNVDYTQKVTQLQVDHKPIQVVKNGQVIGLEVDRKVHVNDGIYRAN